MSYRGKFATILEAKFNQPCLMPKLKQVVTQDKILNDALVDSNDVLQCVYSITYKANK